MSKTITTPILALLAGWLLPAAASAATIQASANNSFVSAENAGASFLVANRATASGWEQFSVVSNSDGTTSLQATVNGRFVTTDLANGGRLIASQAAIGTNEKFRMVTQANGTVSFQALSNNQWVSADLNIAGVLIANRASPSTWEQFTVSGVSAPPTGGAPNFGPNVIIFDPSMAQATIQNQVTNIGNQQQNNQFRSEEHTSELQSQFHLVCRLLLEKKQHNRL